MPKIPLSKLKALVDRESRKKRPDDYEERSEEAEVGGEKVARYVEEEGERVNDGKQDPELKKLMRNFDPEKNPPQWVASESTWERAKEAVDPEGDGADKYDEPYAVVAHVYKRLGGRIKGGKK